MTDEFLKRLQEANEKAIKVYKKEDEKFLEECKKNKKYVDLYLDLVLSFIEVFDYKTGHFNVELIDKDLSETIGNPERIYACIYDDEQVASIHFHYKRNGYDLTGLPDFIENDKINFYVVNEVLSENGISVSSDLWDGGDRGSDDYIVKFDASLLIATRKSLMEDGEKSKKKILS